MARVQPCRRGHDSLEDDGRRVTITLRDGLAFHDGSRVLARDAVASIRRWLKRNPYGQKLEPVIDKVFPLTEVAAAQEYSKTGRAKGKIVLEVAAPKA